LYHPTTNSKTPRVHEVGGGASCARLGQAA
jgi:hypothetical protein